MPTKPVIAIAGPSGSGKSTLAKHLAKRLGWRCIDTGAIFRKLAEENRMGLLEFGEYAETHPEIDRALDERVAKAVRQAKKGIILQGRLAAWTLKKFAIPSKKFWVTAALPVRVKRIAGREGQNYQETLRQVTKRDRDNRRRYLTTYGLDLNDLSVYDAVIDTGGLSIEETVLSIIKHLPKIWLKK
jgi:cytidylate kinase